MDIQDKADFFISHASEDKEEFVRDLAETLLKNGANVFYDEYSIKLGDSLTDSINKGLTTTNNAILVLSKYFFEKSWTQAELQAIFHKARTTGYKILIIYHNITNKEVTEKYPLLSDIKAIDSKEGLNKIIEALFNAIDKKPSLAYLYTDLNGGKSGAVGTGFSIALRFGFPFLGNKRIEKTLFEIGTPNVYNNRIRIHVVRNERLYFEVTDSSFRKLSLSLDMSDWKLNEQHFFIGNIDKENSTMFIMLDGTIKDELTFGDLTLPNDFMDSGRSIFGCSLELENPSPFIISMQSLGRSFTKEQCVSYTKAVDQFTKDIGRK
jgi:hypothetical protein